MVAMAVPQEPAPTTATRSLMVKRLRRTRDTLHVRPYPVQVSRATLPAPFTTDARLLAHDVVLVPVKAFHQAKRRLGSAMTDEERVGLVKAMATHVVAACAPHPVAVVCDDEGVATWATALGAIVMWEPGQG